MSNLVVELPVESVPDLSKFPIEDGLPVDSVHNELQQRLLTVSLQRPWPGLRPGRCWRVFANVGYFFRTRPTRGLAPDVMLSLDIEQEDPLSGPAERSYFLWERGKPPEVVIEVVSDYSGEELGTKLTQYANGQVPYYAVFDPRRVLGPERLHAFRRDPDSGHYARLARPWFPPVSLGLTLWEGDFEGIHSAWIRWCDEQGNLIPTAYEDRDEQRQRADRLAARLRELGVNPEEV